MRIVKVIVGSIVTILLLIVVFYFFVFEFNKGIQVLQIVMVKFRSTDRKLFHDYFVPVESQIIVNDIEKKYM
jgi:hypothetical protein